MNQQREVIYSLRAFALEGGEELKGEALKMIEKALGAARRDSASPTSETAEEWDFELPAAGAAHRYITCSTVDELGPAADATSTSTQMVEAVEAGRGGVRREDRVRSTLVRDDREPDVRRPAAVAT